MTTTNNEILLKLEELLKERSWTLYRLAKESDVPYSSLSNMFARNTQPTISTLEKLCTGLGISMSTFFDTPLLTPPNTVVLTDEEKELIELYRELNTHDRELLFAYLHGLSRVLPDPLLPVK